MEPPLMESQDHLIPLQINEYTGGIRVIRPSLIVSQKRLRLQKIVTVRIQTQDLVHGTFGHRIFSNNQDVLYSM